MTNRISILLAGCFGFLAFALCGGLHILNVSNIGFLMAGDPAQHWIGWEFFRHTPFIQWPLGNNGAYGIGLNNSIVYTDSIPIVAILFKYISPVLPEKFQYTGLWLASCFILQGICSYNLLYKLTVNKAYSLLSAVILLCSSAMLIRVTGHYALSAHWLLILSLSLYLDKKYLPKRWYLLILLSSTVHAYLLIINIAIWLSNILNRFINGDIKIKKAACDISLTIVSLAFLMYALGYFNVHGGTVSDGYGYYKLNINALINPIFTAFSTIISPMPSGGGDYEGLSYLGLGVISLIIISMVFYPAKKNQLLGLYTRNIVLFSLCLLLTIYSISQNITIGNYTLLHYRIPSLLEGITSTFRATGRFFWPVYYIIIITTLLINYRLFKSRVAIFILLFCTAIQAFDLQDAFKEVRRFYYIDAKVNEPTGIIWKNVESNKRNIIATPPSDFTNEWMEWGYYASTHNIQMNFGYFARYDRKALESQTVSAFESIGSGRLSNKNVYIFKQEALYKEAISNYKGKYLTEKFGTTFVLMPE